MMLSGDTEGVDEEATPDPPKPYARGSKPGTPRRRWGTLRKVADQRYQASYQGPDRQRHFAPMMFQTITDAEGWFSREHSLITSEKWTPPAERLAKRWEKTVTLSEYADEWLPARRTRDGQPLRARTQAHYRSLLDDHLKPGLGDVELLKLTPERIQKWFDSMDSSKPTVRAHAYSLLRSILTTASKGDKALIPSNPCQIVGGGSTRRKKEINIPTLKELGDIVEHIPPKYRVLVLITAWCGLRFGEVTELRRKDLNLTKQNLRVQRGVVKVPGGFLVGEPKTYSSIRTVAIPPHLMPAIREHLDNHADPGRDGLLFPAKQGGHLSQSSVQKVFGNAARKAGREDLRFHDLRHTGATLAAATGATLAELMARLGHSTPAAAMRYQHAARGRDALIAQALSDIATGAVEQPE